MKVAMLNRDMETSHFGGDVVHVKTLSKYLRNKGLDVVLNPPLDNLSKFDIIHCWHLNFEFSRDNLVAANNSGRPIILTTIYYESDKHGTDFKEQLELLSDVRRVVSYSLPEANGIRQCTGFNKNIEIIAPGVEKMFHWKDGGDREYDVITATARDLEKNTPKLEFMLAVGNHNYRNFTGLDRDRLADAYRLGKVFVQASEVECYGLTILEALAAGCRVLATKYSKGAQTLPGIMLIDPLDFDNVKFHIKRALALSDKEWNWLPNATARLMSWEHAAFRYNAIYEELIRHH